MQKPLFTLANRQIPPYRDFLYMYWRINRILILAVSFILLAGIAYSIFLIIRPFDWVDTFVFAMVGIGVVLLLTLVFIVPEVNRRATAKSLTKLEIRFYQDRLIALPAGQQEMGRGVAIYYKEFERRFETRTSIICIRGKGGVVLSKKDPLPESVVALLLNREPRPE